MMMDFADFTETVKDEVGKTAGSNYQIRLSDVRKNNGVILRGITVTENDNNISPTIYLNDYYQDYMNGRTTLDGVITGVMGTYHKNKINQNVDMGYFLDYGKVRQRIVYKLINTEKNRELLNDIPHVEFLDLSIVFQCLVTQENLGMASILIYNAHRKVWGVSVEDLYQAAQENTPLLLEYEIRSMSEVLCEIMKAGNPEEFNHDECITGVMDSIPMYVLSNKRGVEGVACMLYPDLIRDFSDEINSSFYIIPSSIHELLLLPAEHDEESGEIRSMIKEINDT